MLKPKKIEEIRTFDVLFNDKDKVISHGITTVFKVNTDNKKINLDDQSIDYDWKFKDDWLKENQHDFVLEILKYYC